jgi:hypothetical protein
LSDSCLFTRQVKPNAMANQNLPSKSICNILLDIVKAPSILYIAIPSKRSIISK